MSSAADAPREPLFNTNELAAYLNVPLSWIYNNKHLLPGFRVGKELRYRRAEIEDWLELRRESTGE
jgi:excisionase family DNA binding protein